MPDQSRRSFLKRASITAAAAGAATVVPVAAADADAEGQVPVHGPAHEGSFAVWVKDARTGEIAVLVGESEVIHYDKALARKLARLAARGA
jgi:hypothetical protein